MTNERDSVYHLKPLVLLSFLLLRQFLHLIGSLYPFSSKNSRSPAVFVTINAFYLFIFHLLFCLYKFLNERMGFETCMSSVLTCINSIRGSQGLHTARERAMIDTLVQIKSDIRGASLVGAVLWQKVFFSVYMMANLKLLQSCNPSMFKKKCVFHAQTVSDSLKNCTRSPGRNKSPLLYIIRNIIFLLINNGLNHF